MRQKVFILATLAAGCQIKDVKLGEWFDESTESSESQGSGGKTGTGGGLGETGGADTTGGAAGLGAGGVVETSCVGLEVVSCQEWVWDDTSQSCIVQALADGSSCISSDLCQENAVCQSGSCVGTAVDCSNFVLDSVCTVAECNPSTGACEAVANPLVNGQSCDEGDPCMLNKTCEDGLCGGGSAKDCSSLNEGAGQCFAGMCNSSGDCELLPVADGTACNKICTSGASCQSGTCGGGVEDAACMEKLKGGVIALGYEHSCGLKEDGSLWCWGYNGYGQLGTVSSDTCDGYPCSKTPIKVGSAIDWAALALGDWHSCGMKQDGSLWCWGANDFGQLGVGNTNYSPTPIPVGSSTDWASISLGDWHSCGLKQNGSLWCWGDNNLYGQLGTGSTNDSTTPIPVGSSTDWASISLGDRHSCGMKQNGSLWCWGDNDFGQLGVGNTNSSPTPIPVGSSTDWASISLRQDHSCGLKQDGSLWCWGANDFGQLGTVSSDTCRYGHCSTTPIKVGSATDWAGLALGARHSCGLKQDGSLWCWGNNLYSQLGTVSSHTCYGPTSGYNCSKTPIPVGSSTDWASISLGDWHSCGLKQDGSLWCWGWNFFGQLGTVGSDTCYVDNCSKTPILVSSGWGL